MPSENLCFRLVCGYFVNIFCSFMLKRELLVLRCRAYTICLCWPLSLFRSLLLVCTFISILYIGSKSVGESSVSRTYSISLQSHPLSLTELQIRVHWVVVFFFLILILSGDVELNPGPPPLPQYPSYYHPSNVHEMHLHQENTRLWSAIQYITAQVNRLEGFSRRNNIR